MEEETKKKKKKKAKVAPKPRKGNRSPDLNKRKPRNARHQAKLKIGAEKRAAKREANRLASRMARDGYELYEKWYEHRRRLREPLPMVTS